MSTMDEVRELRIAHITDLHARGQLPGTSDVASRLSRQMFDLAAVALAEFARRRVDIVVLTGDLLDVPAELLTSEADENAERQAEADYRRLRGLLDRADVPYFVLPGNHDLESAFWRVFSRTSDEMQVGGFRLLRFCDHEDERHVPHRLGQERARWEAALGSPDDRPQVHLQHYIITPELNEHYPHTYAKGETIRRANVDSGRVVLCLSGHYHSGTDLFVHGGCHFSAGPAFCEWPHAVRVYDIQNERVTMTSVVVNRPPRLAPKL